MWSTDPAKLASIVESYDWAETLIMSTIQALLAAQCALVGDHLCPADATYHVVRETMWSCDPALTATIVESYNWAGPLFISTLQAILAAQCALVGDHLWPADATHHVIADPNYDFIVVGAGAAGSVIANRLTEVPNWKVLLIEAGGNPTISTESPQMFYNNLDTSSDWSYKTQPSDKSCRSYKTKGCAWPQGKVLGGGTSINGLFYVRGNKADYNEWAAAGNTGWSYEDVLPYFIKSENLTDNTNTPNKEKYHGTSGYLSVESNGMFHEFEKMIMKANGELGVKTLIDINGEDQMGVTRSFSTTQNGIRHSTARAFLHPIKDRPNLHVMKNAYVTKILFKAGTNEVSGVLVNKDGKDISVYAKKEVILSAGAINTPRLLLLSGIGPKKHLEESNIEVKADLPVGENLQDHAFVPVYFKTKSDANLVNLPNIAAMASAFLLHRAGPMSDTSPHKTIGFINTTDPAATSPDIQQHYVIFAPNQSLVLDVNYKHGVSSEYHSKFNKVNENHIILKAYSVLLKPKSRGRILLQTSNPYINPLVYANYFEEPEDLATMLRGMKFNMKLGDTKTFKEAGFELFWVELDACKDLDKSTDKFLECMAMETTFSLYHPTSTVKMGPDSDPEAVVNPELKVRGLKNLRVIDSSIMPTVVRGNTMAACIMFGEKGSDLIKKDWLAKHTEL